MLLLMLAPAALLAPAPFCCVLLLETLSAACLLLLLLLLLLGDVAALAVTGPLQNFYNTSTGYQQNFDNASATHPQIPTTPLQDLRDLYSTSTTSMGPPQGICSAIVRRLGMCSPFAKAWHVIPFEK